MAWILLFAALGCGEARRAERVGGDAILQPCMVASIDEPLQCGDLRVPEVHGSAAGRSITVHIVVVPALRRSAAEDPWVELVGGPGNAATDFARSFVEDLRYIRRDRDVLLVDQRGTGGSNPLYCPELGLHQISSLPPRFPADAVERCRDHLSRVADLAHYTSVDAAEDLELVRQALGYRQFNLFGSSYGTRVALEYMRRYPQHTRSAILWGVVPPDFRRPLNYPRDGQRAFERLVEDCNAEPECHAAYPAIAGDLNAVLDRLDKAPVPVTLSNPGTGDPIPTAFTNAGVAQAVWNALSYPDRARRLPYVLHRAAGGDYEPLRALDVATSPPKRRYYNAMHLSVVCGEEVLQNSDADIEGASLGSFMPAARGMEYLVACRHWGVPRAQPASLAPVVSSVPTLIVSGEMDPITPPRWGDQVARGLPQSRHVVVPHLSHEANGLRGAECLDSLFARFLAKPSPPDVKPDCASTVQPPSFKLHPE